MTSPKLVEPDRDEGAVHLDTTPWVSEDSGGRVCFSALPGGFDTAVRWRSRAGSTSNPVNKPHGIQRGLCIATRRPAKPLVRAHLRMAVNKPQRISGLWVIIATSPRHPGSVGADRHSYQRTSERHVDRIVPRCPIFFTDVIACELNKIWNRPGQASGKKRKSPHERYPEVPTTLTHTTHPHLDNPVNENRPPTAK